MEECLQSLPAPVLCGGERDKQMLPVREHEACRKIPLSLQGSPGGQGETIALFSTFTRERAIFSSPTDDQLGMLRASNVDSSIALTNKT